MKAIVLLSGGIDSTCCLYTMKELTSDIEAVTFSYGQRHSQELKQARRIAEYAKVHHNFVYLTMPHMNTSLAANSPLEVPKNQMTETEGIPSTYVPGRNTIFLAIAASLAESLSFDLIVIGANAVDYSGYPDCRPEYIDAMNYLMTLSSKKGISGKPIQVYAPIINFPKSEIIKKASDLNAPLHLTHSCYDPQDDKACGVCDSCRIRRKGFHEANIVDPTQYYKEN